MDNEKKRLLQAGKDFCSQIRQVSLVAEIDLGKGDFDSVDVCCNTLTEIIDTFNKTDKLDNSKLSIIAENKPELLDDEIFISKYKKLFVENIKKLCKL